MCGVPRVSPDVSRVYAKRDRSVAGVAGGDSAALLQNRRLQRVRHAKEKEAQTNGIIGYVSHTKVDNKTK